MSAQPNKSVGKLEGKVAVITGGTSGIGLATAKRFIAEGAHVFITGRRQAELEAAAQELGEHATAVRGDVARAEDLDRLYETVKKQKGRVDIVFANAGVGDFTKLEDITEENFDKTFDVNVKGVLFTVQKALPLLREGGSIILNASIVATKGSEAFSVYSASKAAVRSFARTWTMDLRSRRIRVNAISPGYIPTPGYVTNLGYTQTQVDQLATSAPNVPMGRGGTPDEVARAVTFLASEDASYITGIELFVDGGVAQI